MSDLRLDRCPAAASDDIATTWVGRVVRDRRPRSRRRPRHGSADDVDHLEAFSDEERLEVEHVPSWTSPVVAAVAGGAEQAISSHRGKAAPNCTGTGGVFGW